MTRRALPLFMLLLCGCQSDYRYAPRPRPFDRLINSMLSSHCPAREIAPGSKWYDYDDGGGWVELGTDGKTHPISTPPGKSDDPRNGR